METAAHIIIGSGLIIVGILEAVMPKKILMGAIYVIAGIFIIAGR